MLYLFDRYGTDFMSRCTGRRRCRAWPASQAQLDGEGVSNMYQVMHDFQTMTLVDRIVGNTAWHHARASPKSRVTTRACARR